MIKAAIIGCGGRGREHAVGYAAAPDTEIVAVVDPKVEAREKLAADYEVKHTYATHQEMFAAHKPDIVSICTWIGWHHDQLMDTVASLPPFGIGMEACGSAPHWGRAFEQLGHTIKLMHPKYVKPSVKTNKHDRRERKRSAKR